MATPLSDERLAEIRERCDKATQGPWELEIKGADAAPLVIVWARYPHREGLHRHFITYTEYGEKPDPDVLQRNSDNYAFIAAARTDMPDLLAEVERLRARNAALEGVLREVEWGAGTYVYDDDGGRMIPTCPRCLAEKREGHAPDCALDAALRASNE